MSSLDRRLICATCSPALPIIQSIASASFCLGTGSQAVRPSLPPLNRASHRANTVVAPRFLIAKAQTYQSATTTWQAWMVGRLPVMGVPTAIQYRPRAASLYVFAALRVAQGTFMCVGFMAAIAYISRRSGARARGSGHRSPSGACSRHHVRLCHRQRSLPTCWAVCSPERRHSIPVAGFDTCDSESGQDLARHAGGVTAHMLAREAPWMSARVQVFGCRDDETIPTLGRPASEKRQCTKSWGCGTDRAAGAMGIWRWRECWEDNPNPSMRWLGSKPLAWVGGTSGRICTLLDRICGAITGNLADRRERGCSRARAGHYGAFRWGVDQR